MRHGTRPRPHRPASLCARGRRRHTREHARGRRAPGAGPRLDALGQSAVAGAGAGRRRGRRPRRAGPRRLPPGGGAGGAARSSRATGRGELVELSVVDAVVLGERRTPRLDGQVARGVAASSPAATGPPQRVPARIVDVSQTGVAFQSEDRLAPGDVVTIAADEGPFQVARAGHPPLRRARSAARSSAARCSRRRPPTRTGCAASSSPPRRPAHARAAGSRPRPGGTLRRSWGAGSSSFLLVLAALLPATASARADGAGVRPRRARPGPGQRGLPDRADPPAGRGRRAGGAGRRAAHRDPARPPPDLHRSAPRSSRGRARRAPSVRNDLGFRYLVEALAARGYLALAVNLNAAYTLGAGEPPNEGPGPHRRDRRGARLPPRRGLARRRQRLRRAAHGPARPHAADARRPLQGRRGGDVPGPRAPQGARIPRPAPRRDGRAARRRRRCWWRRRSNASHDAAAGRRPDGRACCRAATATSSASTAPPTTTTPGWRPGARRWPPPCSCSGANHNFFNRPCKADDAATRDDARLRRPARRSGCARRPSAASSSTTPARSPTPSLRGIVAGGLDPYVQPPAELFGATVDDLADPAVGAAPASCSSRAAAATCARNALRRARCARPAARRSRTARPAGRCAPGLQQPAFPSELRLTWTKRGGLAAPRRPGRARRPQRATTRWRCAPRSTPRRRRTRPARRRRLSVALVDASGRRARGDRAGLAARAALPARRLHRREAVTGSAPLGSVRVPLLALRRRRPRAACAPIEVRGDRTASGALLLANLELALPRPRSPPRGRGDAGPVRRRARADRYPRPRTAPDPARRCEPLDVAPAAARAAGEARAGDGRRPAGDAALPPRGPVGRARASRRSRTASSPPCSGRVAARCGSAAPAGATCASSSAEIEDRHGARAGLVWFNQAFLLGAGARSVCSWPAATRGAARTAWS